ncbi:hypothetical protein N2152v2_001254 [Parachlorella kessleri]
MAWILGGTVLSLLSLGLGSSLREGEAAALDLAVCHYVSMLFMQRLRTAADRTHATAVLQEFWPAEQQGQQTHRPSFLITPAALQFGWAILDRTAAGAAGAGAGSEAGESLGLLDSQLPVLECLTECASRGWMCLLVGPPSSGKTAAVRALAQLSGRPLLELPLTSGTDTSDLLGGFEQMEPERKIQEAGREVHALVLAVTEHALTCQVVGGDAQNAQQALEAVARAWDTCSQALSGTGSVPSQGAAAITPEAQTVLRQRAALQGLRQVAAAAHALAAQLEGADASDGGELAGRAADVAGRMEALGAELAQADAAAAGKFEWVDGALTRAIERGQWVLLDNANLCNPTVLDRLNPLLEPQGELYLNECGTGSKGPRVVRPHPGFRLFLALDPRHGEVSRAMRNRGIEIFLLPADPRAPAGPLNGSSLPAAGNLHAQELEATLGYEGIPGRALPHAMAAAHAEVVAHAAQRHRRPPSLRQLKHWAQLAAALACRGWEPRAALSTAFQQVYVQGEGFEEARVVAAAAHQAHCCDAAAFWGGLEGAESRGHLSLFRPAAWPLPLTTSAFAAQSALTSVLRDGSVLQQQLALLFAPESAALLCSSNSSLFSAASLEAQSLGLAATALLPGPVLVSTLQGRDLGAVGATTAEASSMELDQSPGVGEADSAWLADASAGRPQHAMLCLLAAAQVYVERSGVADLSTRSAWAAAIAQQAHALWKEQLPGGASPAAAPCSTAQAAQLAAQVVQELLAHPTAAALAELQGPLMDSMGLPPLARALLPLEPSSAVLLQPHLLASGASGAEVSTGGANGSSALELWGRLQVLASKRRALQAAVESAVLLRAAVAEGEGEAGPRAPTTLLQLSHWRFQHPKERTRRPVPHPAVDWLYPLLQAVQGVEESLVPPTSHLPWSSRLAEQVAALQEWRWALFQAIHANSTTAAPEHSSRHFEALVFIWLHLWEAANALLADVARTSNGVFSSWRQGEALAQVAAQQHAALGLAGRAPDKPYLWKHGGRPLLPRTAALCEGHAALLALCEVTSVGPAGYELDFRGQPAAFARAGITLATLEQSHDGSGGGSALLSAAARASAGEAASASLSSDVALRSALLEGLCLFASGAITEQRQGPGVGSTPAALVENGASQQSDAQFREVPQLLASKVIALAEAAVQSALALQQELREGKQQQAQQPEEAALYPSSSALGGEVPAAGALVAVPDGGRAVGDFPGPDGSLPEILPPHLMQYPSCRAMQLGLVALQDLSLNPSQLHLMGSGLLALLAPSHPPGPAGAFMLGMLGQVVRRAVLSGCRSVASVAPHQQLAWLLEAQPAEQEGSSASKWRRVLRQSLVHQAWFGFHQGLWAGASGTLPAAHAGHISAEAAEGWASLMAGPMRLHTATLTAHATSLAASAATTAVADRTAAVLQLKLGARQLRRLAAAEAAHASDPLAIAAAEWAAAAAVAAATLQAHLAAVDSGPLREKVAQALHWLVAIRCSTATLLSVAPHQEQQQQYGVEDEAFLRTVGSAFTACSHALLGNLVDSLLMPCLKGLLRGTAGLVARGQVWALLGLLRLHLAVPPPGTDPAAKYALLRQHTLSTLSLRLEPELSVRRQYQQLPAGGPDESTQIAALEARAGQLREAAERLEGRCVPRPVPPAYLALREEVARFAEGFAAAGRVAATVQNLATGSSAAASQAATWQQNAAAWADRLGQQYSAYRDLVQPIQLAVQEVRYGLSLMAGSAALLAMPSVGTITAAAATLMAFPLEALGGNATPSLKAQQQQQEEGMAAGRAVQQVPLEATDVQQAVAELAATAAGAAAATGAALAAGAGDAEHAHKARDRLEVARMSARLRLLRVALHHAARAVASARENATGAETQQPDLQEAQQRLHRIFPEFVGAWEELKAEEERRTAEEAELFKTKTRSTDIATEEQARLWRPVGVMQQELSGEDEADYQAQFPEHFAAFVNLAADDEETVDLDAEQPLQASQPQAQQAAAAYSARDLVQGEVLQELVAVHRAAFASFSSPQHSPTLLSAASPASPQQVLPGLDPDSQFLLSYELGTSVLRSAGLCLPAVLDGATASGHLMAVALRHRQLSQGPTGSDSVDVQSACIEEAVLVQKPLAAVQARLGQLLEEWPDHPVLEQLSAIAARVLALPVTSPLKQLLTGVELLLARAQVWEETAAKHVSLSGQLGQVAALASRWRQLELASWRGLLQRTVHRFAQSADKAWFHLYGILVCGTSSTAEVAAVLEQFMQACPVGEFGARLDLLHSFRCQLAAMATQHQQRAVEDPQHVARRQQLAAVLYNVHRYYSQFRPHVEQQIGSELKQLEKELQDFVTLAKWEDRGYYAQRIATEKAQRQLHRLSRRAIQALKEPAGEVLMAAARSMGFNDLAAPALDLLEISQQAASAAPAAAAAGKKKKCSRKAAAEAADSEAALMGDEAAETAAAAFGATCKEALSELDALEAAQGQGQAGTLADAEGAVQEPMAGEAAGLGGKYAGQLPRLTRRFRSVLVGQGQAGGSSPAAVAGIDGLASEAAERALALRDDAEKGARSRKKKALTDLLKGLAAAGVSRRRTAVPPSHRGVQAWFGQAAADPRPLLALGQGAASSSQREAANVAWAKADTYYYRTLARMQRLWEAANHPHADLAPHEVESACRMSEHLVYLVQQGRSTLGVLSRCYQQLARLLSLLSTLGPAVSAAEAEGKVAIPAQAPAREWVFAQQQRLTHLASFTANTARLLRAAAAAESAPAPRAQLSTAAGSLDAVLTRVKACSARLAAAVGSSVGLAGGGLFVPPAAVAALKENTQVLQAVHAELSAAGDSQEYRSGVPGWHQLAVAFGEAAAESAQAGQLQQASSGHVGQGQEGQSEEAARGFSEALEAAVAAALVWAQNARPPEVGGAGAAAAAGEAREGDDLEEPLPPAQPIPELLQTLERRMGLPRLQELCTHTTSALSQLAAAAAGSPLAAKLASTLCLLGPMLSMLQGSLCQLGLQYLAAHKATAKLAYVAASLFAGLVQEGFCMPEAEAGEGEGGEGKMGEGTGLGEGDTRGAKDISDQLEDQDQLLGAKQKGQQEPEQQQQDGEQEEHREQQREEKGVEMDEDFDGSLEDVQRDPNAQSGRPWSVCVVGLNGYDGDEEKEKEEEGDRLDQQMGDAGDAAEAVDERMWDEDKDEEEGQQEAGGYDRDAPLQVDDKSSLDFAAGQDQPLEEEGGDEEGADKQQQRRQQQQAGGQEEQQEREGGEDDMEQAGEEDEEQQQELGEYPDRQQQQEQEGHVQPEGQDPEFELPEDLNLDGAEGLPDEGEPGGKEEHQGEGEEENGAPDEAPEQTGASPDSLADEQEQEGAGAEEQQGQPAEGEEDGAPQGEEQQQPQGLLEPEPQPGEGEGGEEAPQDEDAELAEAQQDAEQAEQQAPAEAGPKGLPSAAAAAAAAGLKQGAGEGEREEDAQVAQQDAAAALPAGLPPPAAAGEAPPQAGGSAAGAAEGLQRDASVAQQSAAGQDQQSAAEAQRRRQQGLSDANPYRNLGSALERWRARLAMTAAAPEPQDAAEEQQQAELEVQQADQGGEDAPPAGGEYRFLGQDEGRQQGDTQALAPATEDQAVASSAQREEQQADASGLPEEAEENDGMEEGGAADEGAAQQAQQQELAGGQANWGAGAGRKAGLSVQDAAQQDENMEEAQPEGGSEHEEEDEGVLREGGGEAAGESYVSAQLARVTLQEGGPAEELWELSALTREQAQALREQLDERLKAASEGALAVSSEAAAAHGRDVWARCDALTSGLVGELAEQLRLILEPTLASRLAGDYRTGKRINMKKVIAYIASHFRKDKIWMRRTRPDKRRYQVVLAVDDSRSMAETGTSSFALEALTLISKAMARLEVGELGIVSFGGSGGVQPLHPLERPFTDADGVIVMSQMRFDQDNTITDRPMVDVITSLTHLLEGAAARTSAAAHGSASLHQLVLIIADGRFHEKESLRRMVREATSQPGVLYAFIVLDNPANSILDMQTVSFVGGKPVFAQYMDSFPFPFYIVLRDTAALPRTLADLIRQWFELSST